MRENEIIDEELSSAIESFSAINNNVDYEVRTKTPIKIRYVYLISRLGTMQYKIGIATDIKKRIQALSTATPDELKLMFSVRSEKAEKIEKYIHQLFHDNRIRGEWFLFTNREVIHTILAMILFAGGDAVEKIFNEMVENVEKIYLEKCGKRENNA